MLKKLIKATRPATLFVALWSTILGITVAYRKGYIFKDYSWDIWRIFLALTAALLLQSGVNMINNYFEEDVDERLLAMRNSTFLGYKRSREEIVNFKIGIAFFIVTVLIGLYLSFYSGYQLILIEILGIFAAYAYSGEPFNYKKYGLGAVMSFIMMGPLLSYASFYVFTKKFSPEPILYSFTMGLFIPAILMANELRDYEEDKSKGVGTLTVRIGFRQGKILYYSLISLSYINLVVLVEFGVIPILSIVVLSTLPFVKELVELVKNNRKKLIPVTAKLYSIFSMELLIVLIFAK